MIIAFLGESIKIYRENLVSAAKNATLLEADERLLFPRIPRSGNVRMGQSNVWYADTPEAEDLKNKVLEHIEEYEKIK